MNDWKNASFTWKRLVVMQIEVIEDIAFAIQ